MTALLDPNTAERLAKLCGMFGSDHDAERAAAARMAHRLVNERGLSWFDVILPVNKRADVVEEQIGMALANLDALSMWERGFIYTIRYKSDLSPKQLAVLDRLAAKARTYQDGGRAAH